MWDGVVPGKWGAQGGALELPEASRNSELELMGILGSALVWDGVIPGKWGAQKGGLELPVASRNSELMEQNSLGSLELSQERDNSMSI